MRKISRNNVLPFYQQTKDILRKTIAAGRFKAARPLPSEEALAAEIGVSPMTVRRAVVELSREGLLERIRGRGTFVRGSFVSPPRRRTAAGCIGIVAPYDQFEVRTSLFYYRILQGIQGAADSTGLPLTFKKVVEPHAAFVSALRLDRSLKGLIVLGILNQELLQLLAKLAIPAVLVDSIQPEGAPAFDEVNHTGEEGAYQAVSTLIEYGHREIGLLISQSFGFFFKQRQAGYERALAAHGITARPELVYPMRLRSYTAYACTQQLLNTGRVPTALFCASDELAIGAMAAISDHGWRVPRDVSVVGFGDLGQFSSPALSTVRIPVEQMGQTAIGVLNERLAEPAAPLKRVLLPAEWIPRASCDVPRVREESRHEPAGGHSGEEEKP